MNRGKFFALFVSLLIIYYIGGFFLLILISILTVLLYHQITKENLSKQDNKLRNLARSKGYKDYSIMKKAEIKGAENPLELAEILGGKYIDRDEWLSAKNLGYSNSRDYKRGQFLNAKNFEEYYLIISGGFTSRENWLRASDLGYKTKIDFDKGNSLEARNHDEYRAIIFGGFFDRDEWDYAKNLGYYKKSEFKRGQSLRARNYEEYQAISSGGFASREKWLRANDLGLKSNENLIIAEKLNVTDQKEYIAIINGNFKNKDEYYEAKLVDIDSRKEYLNSQNVKQILTNFKADIPVQLTRIVKLANLDENKVEKIIREISDSNKLGKYYPLEQVFIRSAAILLEEEIKEKGQPTNNICIVCRRNIYSKEDYAECSLCSGTAHISELLEWFKSKSICPKCREAVKESDFIIYRSKK